MTVDNLDGWLRALYFAVLIPGYSLVIFQVRMYFKNKYEPETVEWCKILKLYGRPKGEKYWKDFTGWFWDYVYGSFPQ